MRGEPESSNPRIVEMPSWNPVLIGEMRDGAADVGFPIQAELYLPAEVSGRVPAVVISEGLGGLKDARERRYGAFLAQHGCVALAIDSFGSRGFAEYGELGRAVRLTESMLTADAFAGLRYLAGLEQVDANRIHVVGFSYGGMAAVLTAYRQLADLFLPRGPRFAGHVSYYGCSVPRLDDPKTTGGPVTMLVGELDRNVSIARTKSIAADLRSGGSDAKLTIFEKTYHQWDGADETKRWVAANLQRCRMRLSPDHEIREERTGLRVRGRVTRTMLLTMWADPRGYIILRDRERTRASDDILLEAVLKT